MYRKKREQNKSLVKIGVTFLRVVVVTGLRVSIYISSVIVFFSTYEYVNLTVVTFARQFFMCGFLQKSIRIINILGVIVEDE